MKNKKKVLINSLFGVLIALCVVCTIFLNNYDYSKIPFLNLKAKEDTPEVVPPKKEETPEIIDNTIDSEDEVVKDRKTNYEEGKAINPDYVGQIYFESGLIDLPFVQGKDNNQYFRTDWKTNEYFIEGSVFLDANDVLGVSQNLIIYGHNVEKSYDASMSHMFTPLQKLYNQKNYEANKYVCLYLGDHIEKYEIVACYRVTIVEYEGAQYLGVDEPIYLYPDYASDYFQEYHDKVMSRRYYDTGLDFTSQDKLLTLQTCMPGSIDKFIVLAKLVENTKIQ